MKLPALDDADCLPNDRAVWRRHDGSRDAPPHAAGQRVSLEFGSGPFLYGYGDQLEWCGARRWRFGWPPRRDR